jgi:hypothetical protein
MTDDLATWFRDLSLVEAEIRNEIKRYEYEGVTPRDVGVRIRQHPAMAITAAIKSRNAVSAQMSYSGERPQTILFRRKDKAWLEGNVEAVRRFVGRISRELPEEDIRGRPAFRGVAADQVIRFLGEYEFHENSQSVRSEYLTKYINSELKAGALTKWSVVFMTGHDLSHTGIDLGLQGPIALMNRSRLETSDDGVANMKAIVSTADRIADLTQEELALVLGPKRVPGTDGELLNLRETALGATGLLCIYPISRASRAAEGGARKGARRVDMDAAADVIGLATFFPRAQNDDSLVTYLTAAITEQTFESLDDELAQIESADSADEIVADTSVAP